MKKLARISIYVVLGFVGVFVLIQILLFASIPFIESRINSKEIPYQVDIDAIFFNPFKPSIRLASIELSPKPSEGEDQALDKLELDSLVVNLEVWKSLKSQSFAFKILAEDANALAHYSFEKKEEEKEAPPPSQIFEILAEAQQKTLEASHLWIAEIKLENINVVVHSPEIGEIGEVKSFNMTATNLGKAAPPISNLELSAATSGEGKIWGESSFTRSDTPNLNIDFKLENLHLAEFKESFEKLGNLDPEAGTLSIYAEVATNKTQLNGYIKLLAKDMEIYDRDSDSDEPLGDQLWEGIAEAAKAVLEADETGAVAFEMPIQGSLDEAGTDIISIVTSILKNAFVDAIGPGFEEMGLRN